MTPIPIRKAETAPAGMSAFQLTNEMAHSHFPFPFSWAKIQSLEKRVKKGGFPLMSTFLRDGPQVPETVIAGTSNPKTV